MVTSPVEDPATMADMNVDVTAMEETSMADSTMDETEMRPRMDRPIMRDRPTMMREVAAMMEESVMEQSMEVATGSVFIQTPGGWATVIDSSGRPRGQTPLRLTLPVGSHVLQLRCLRRIGFV